MRTRTVRQRYRVKLHSDTQREYVKGLLGAGRALYNMFLWEREQEWKKKCSNQDYEMETMGKTVSRLTAFKSLPEEYEWLKQYPAWTIQKAAIEGKDAYLKWWNSNSGKSAAKQHKPRYKKKDKNRSSVMFERPKNGFTIRKLNKNNSRIWLGKKIGWIKFKDSREELPLNITGVSLIQEPSGKIYISFVCQQIIAESQITENTDLSSVKATAADLGVADLLVWITTDGQRGKIQAPRYYRKAQRKLKRAQQDHSRKKDGSKNKNKSRLKVARVHEQVRNSRQDLQRKIASKLASENQVVCLETLNVAGMLKNRNLAKSISDASFGGLIEAIKNACEKSGTSVLQADKWSATTRTCSVCGCYREEPLPLNIRVWQCVECDAWLDRDWNAALNILLAAGLVESLNDCGGDIRRKLACADPVEAVNNFTRA